MDGDKTTDSSDEHVMRALGRIREAFESETPANQDVALELLCEKLFEFRPNEVTKHAEAPVADVTNFSNILGRDGRVEAVLRWLKDTKGFAPSELDLARRAGIFEEAPDGRLVLCEQPLPYAWASIFIAVVALLTGFWVAWVCFASEGNLTVISASFTIGSLFGLAVGMALDKSFRFVKLRAKILEAAPRFGDGLLVHL